MSRAAEEGKMPASSSMMAGAPELPRRRILALRIASFSFGIAALGGLFGIGLVIGWFDTGEGGIHRVHDLGFGVLFGIVVAGAFFFLMLHPVGRPSVMLQVVAVAIGVAVAALVSGDPAYLALSVALLIATAIVLALHPARREVLRPRSDFSRTLFALVLIGAVPLVWFGLSAARLQRNGSPIDPHVAMSHWTTMASVAFGLIAVGLLASMRIRGWRFTAWCCGLALSVYGVASIAFAHFPGSGLPYAGSEGVGWGIAALVGGLSFIGAAELAGRALDTAGMS
jgi:hypothetical protein